MSGNKVGKISESQIQKILEQNGQDVNFSVCGRGAVGDIECVCVGAGVRNILEKCHILAFVESLVIQSQEQDRAPKRKEDLGPGTEALLGKTGLGEVRIDWQ